MKYCSEQGEKNRGNNKNTKSILIVMSKFGFKKDTWSAVQSGGVLLVVGRD
jgi:hypothetical protein